MIVETDFLDHWKTRLIVRLLGTESAPLHIIRLWSHCQTRKTNRFPDWNPEILSAVCKWGGDANAFWSAILQTFGRIEDGCFVAHQWDEVNSSLIASWSNGGKGGRPKKPTDNPRVNPELNQVNPQVTHGVTDREDREEKTEKTQADKPPRVRFVPPTLQEVEVRCAEIELPLIEAQKFINYYESKNWIVGKTKMHSWKSSLTGWKLRRDESSQSGCTQPAVKKEIDWRLSA
jgi:hypothetical protein